ncbi:aminodeoxychorismate synthase component I [Propionivibrio dicarboxylicus]|uniref:Para-aminobenzoate synthetase / 4-amino-4-deoxychorismate lyase n=1 Tax=Propionivibrio dicarboxylicus TaxID=83767 RepID=A0A1G8NGU6_9RHOO|nr:aminodeoxychorismate synthase component I [Propionivibrio dicarboxylicus]SDI79378.1 para-aminobenzoate synthetase / 4-amino-4-deoxychorismate lyase [Propionivibrio dicarboxylicus]
MGPCMEAPFALVDSDDGAALWLSGYGGALSIEASSSVDAATFFAAAEAETGAGRWVLIAADYGLGSVFEPVARVPAGERCRLRGWVFARCERLDAVAVDARLQACLAGMSESERAAGVADWRVSLPEADYCAKVDGIQAWIASGDCYQVNLTFPLYFRAFGHPLALYAALRRRQPVRYGAFVGVPGATLLSFSPELFFERTGTRVQARPMKGTAPRGDTAAEDAALRAAMLASDKERAENVMIVDMLRNDLGRLARPGSVRVEALCEAEAYPTVWQQVSTVSAELPEAPLADLFAALFPCASITGAPKLRAMQRIAELEEAPRDLYTGALGWVAPGGDCRFNVAIRSLELGPDGDASLGVGSGIVIDGDPRREYAECLLKARFIREFDPGFELIETLRLEQGRYPLLPLHLKRLGCSARCLGFALDAKAVEAALVELAARHAAGVFRVRLSLAHGGAFHLQAAPLDTSQRAWRFLLAEEVLPDGDFLRAHKTTVRGRYDKALAGLPGDVFDRIFLNRRGEVCEGARSNVFVVRDGIWLTPPLASGLLPGVLRQHLLDSGRAVEQVVTRDDLFTASAVYLGNALRGLVPVQYRDPD